MKIRTLIFPMLVFVCAIGMAFTTTDLSEDPKEQANDYILVNGSWKAISEQEDCFGTGTNCRVQLGTNGPVYDLYDEIGDELPKPSGTDDPIIITP